ncbi:DUF6710 family protein [Marinomonas profundimaris]|uniref:Fip n=1 Tax=Marinomonas profundimaris TaxID=1208321 RepID=W1RT63_9GAMM|nr:DUF6710 family protein [Marinomonas profundimaris]ETI58058.1 Fip [Marinomonas profundimaris]
MFLRKDKKQNLCFENVIRRADELLGNKNLDGLKDLIKLCLRPIQSNHLLSAYIEDDHKATSSLSWMESLGFSFTSISIQLNDGTTITKSFSDWCWSEYCLIDNEQAIPSLSLTTDIVLPTPWEPNRIIRNLGSIGKNRKQGEFLQDPNHIVIYQYPLMIGWVGGGNHSIMQGILTGGYIKPNELHDISILLDAVSYNGKNWIENNNGKVIGQPLYEEFGYCWEIAKKISLLETSPYKTYLL